MLGAEIADVSVVTVGEYSAPGFAHSGNDRDRRAGQPPFDQFVGGSILEKAEQTKLLTSRTGEPDLMPASYAAAHSLPFAAS